ncbi:MULTISPECIES: polyphosphate polymerase domain-containing protein [unclassified Paenibacillus]|uniref:polyphosphate polymerase domain-containing protein n=1 Tax=unclassified Paenibacillus TaxID=185978 RepID=UPI00247590AD|nr:MULTISPECIES: polyphosphate polymerase domain-containing protein [unclassified Paenibacillus]MDH6428960.1 SPX domain protein involved in polyphosphate accumulation [Paenibacillus sp. PastH-4]MDH6445162.1 SPX domain protein involved in polyphosphate accumulation [Paenibacillus sp. PastF-4]MDH6529055.1 SPX domain protein involved in polyphosphate accumulation [Paenibacillus sp. PastH-3]
MAIEVFNRYENKYLLDNEAYYKFYNQLLEYMELDDFNKQHEFYSITNLYYDTEHNTLIRNSLAKPKYKEKLRLRAYGVPNQDTKVYLEIKKKVFGLVNKRRTSLKLNEAYDFVATGMEPEFKDYMNKQVIEEIKYFLTRYDLQPKVYLSYDRKALFCKNNRDLRITFDTNIRSRRYDLKMEHGVHGEPLLEPGQWLMEVKAENTIPVWLAKMLSEHQMYRTSFSKYGNEYKKILKNSKTERESALYA